MAMMVLVPLLLSVLVGILLVLVVWGFLRVRNDEGSGTLMGARDGLLWGLLLLAGLAIGVFLAYVLFRAGF